MTHLPLFVKHACFDPLRCLIHKKKSKQWVKAQKSIRYTTNLNAENYESHHCKEPTSFGCPYYPNQYPRDMKHHHQ